MSSFRSFTPDRIDALLPVSLRLHRERRSALETLSYGGALPALPSALRETLRDVGGVDVAHAPDGVDPFASPGFGILYSRLRAEQVLRAVSARTNLTLAGTTVAVVGDGTLAETLSTSLRTLGAAVIRATDAPVTALAARLDGFRVQPLDELRSRDAPVHLTVLTGEGHGVVAVDTLGGLVADASPGGAPTAGLRTAPSPRPFVGRVGATSLVEMPSPLPEADVPPSSTQWRLLDAVIALLLLDRHDAGDDDRFAREVTP